jgi:hypothetical protein
MPGSMYSYFIGLASGSLIWIVVGMAIQFHLQ